MREIKIVSTDFEYSFAQNYLLNTDSRIRRQSELMELIKEEFPDFTTPFLAIFPNDSYAITNGILFGEIKDADYETIEKNIMMSMDSDKPINRIVEFRDNGNAFQHENLYRKLQEEYSLDMIYLELNTKD